MPINSIKPGVKLDKLTPQAVMAWNISCSVYNHYGYGCVLTSGNDGKHKEGSKHYTGNAIDLRTRHLGLNTGLHAYTARMYPTDIARELRLALAENYDVVLESDHIHVEYDPK